MASPCPLPRRPHVGSRLSPPAVRFSRFQWTSGARPPPWVGYSPLLAEILRRLAWDWTGWREGEGGPGTLLSILRPQGPSTCFRLLAPEGVGAQSPLDPGSQLAGASNVAAHPHVGPKLLRQMELQSRDLEPHPGLAADRLCDLVPVTQLPFPTTPNPDHSLSLAWV